MPDVYTIGPITIGGASPSVLDQITDVGYTDGVRQVLESVGGAVDASFVALASQEQQLTFTTTQLETLLSLNSAAFLIDGMALDGTDVATVYLTKLAEGGTRTTGATHISATVNKGIVTCTGITAAVGDRATASVRLTPTYDQTNDPVAVSTSASLPASLDADQLFTIGPVNINGSISLDDEVRSITLDPGIDLITIVGSASPWPTFAAIQSRAPTIRITANAADLLDTIGTGALAITSGYLYLRKLEEGGHAYADDESEHIKITFYEGLARVSTLTGTHPTLAAPEVIIQPTYDGTNDILTVQTGQTIA